MQATSTSQEGIGKMNAHTWMFRTGIQCHLILVGMASARNESIKPKVFVTSKEGR